MAATYSVYNINIENNLRFKPTGVTAGWILAVNPSGDSYWTAPPTVGTTIDFYNIYKITSLRI
jgi:hypothetical protein